MSGIFITFEGIDGSGKTTQLGLLAERLRAAGRAVTTAREPGGTAVGDAIRRILLDSATTGLTPTAELLLYFASRAQNVAEVIQPALERGEVVLCDRYVDASAAYQSSGRGLGLDVVYQLEAIACRGILPHLTFVLDIEPAAGLARAAGRNLDAVRGGGQNEARFEAESIEFFQRVRRGYLDIAGREPRRVLVIDADRAPEIVAEQIWHKVSRLLE